MKLNDVYKNFKVIKIDDLPDCNNAKGIYLRHLKTGLEVYHILNNDKENVFSISFRTFAKHSKGVAHILEHSVLCGSEKYNDKDPFVVLNQQSMNTFLNAFTYPDKTVYPGASLIPSEYFKMFDVYMDAVFFPNLKKETFKQEGWRLEYTDDKPSIQGVVYNEMKGAYSSPEESEMLAIFQAFKNSYLNYNSGGYPSDIPSLSYEEFLDFHKKYYCPSNAIITIAGNIPTTDNLDFIDTFTERLLNKYGSQNVTDSDKAFIQPYVQEAMKSELRTETLKTDTLAISSATSLNNVVWYIDDEVKKEMSIISMILLNDSCKFYNMLQEEFKEPLTDCSGLMDMYPKSLFTLGIKNKTNVYPTLIKLLKEYAKDIPQVDIDSSIKSLEMNIRKFSSPRNLNYVLRAIEPWTFGKNIIDNMLPLKELIELKAKFNTEYVRSLIEKYLISNKPALDSTICPSEEFSKNMEKEEAENIKKLVEMSDKEQIIAETKSLFKYQESKSNKDLIPALDTKTLGLKDIPKIEYEKGDVVKIEFDSIGLVSLRLEFPMDSFTAQELQNASIWSSFGLDFGYNNLDWKKCVPEASKYVNWYMYTSTNESVISSEYNNRIWMTIQFKFLKSDMKEALSYIKDMLNNPTYLDEDLWTNKFNELKTLTNENVKSSEDNCYFVLNEKDKTLKYSDITSGLAFSKYLNTLNKTPNEMLSEMKRIIEKIKAQGCLMFITSDKDSIQSFESEYKDIYKYLNLKKPVDKIEPDWKGISELSTKLESPKENEVACVKMDTQAGIAVVSFNSSNIFTKEAAAEYVLFEGFASMHHLWTKIRTQGGAYGANAIYYNRSNEINLSSYRDPNPYNSLKAFKETLQELAVYEFTEDETNKAIISVLSNIITSYNPDSYTRSAISKFKNNTSQEVLDKKMLDILSISPLDLHNAAVRALSSYNNEKHEAVTVPKTDKTLINYIEV